MLELFTRWETFALLAGVALAGLGLGAWWGFGEGKFSLTVGQQPALAELRQSVGRLQSWLHPLAAWAVSTERNRDETGELGLTSTAKLCLREVRAIDYYLRDLEGRPRLADPPK